MSCFQLCWNFADTRLLHFYPVYRYCFSALAVWHDAAQELNSSAFFSLSILLVRHPPTPRSGGTTAAAILCKRISDPFVPESDQNRSCFLSRSVSGRWNIPWRVSGDQHQHCYRPYDYAGIPSGKVHTTVQLFVTSRTPSLFRMNLIQNQWLQFNKIYINIGVL